MTIPTTLEAIARRAVAGDRDALNAMIRTLQGDIYGLALKMLWNKEDAEDATQEILVRVVTRLAQFNFQSRLKTWAYRIAVNYILDTKKSAIERLNYSFERFGEGLVEGIQDESAGDAEESLLIDEVKVSCSLAMLQCLDRPHRLAYVLGELMDLSGPEAAEALEISPALFRKRLQVARQYILTFTKGHCGLVSDAAPCRCHRRVPAGASAGTDDVHPLTFGRRKTSFAQARALVRQVEEARWAMELHRSSEPRASAIDFAQRLLRTLDGPDEPQSRS